MKRSGKYAMMAVMSLLLLSCEDNRNDNMLPDSVYLRKAGVYEQGAFVLHRGDERFDLWAFKGGVTGQSGDVVFRVMPEVLDAYNASLPASAQLTLLPTDCYKIPQSRFHVSQEEPMARFAFWYDPDIIAANYGTGRKYALPIGISSDNISIREDMSTALIIFNVDRIEVGFQESPQLVREVKRNDVEYRESLTVQIAADAPEDIAVSISTTDPACVEDYNELYGDDCRLLPETLYTLDNPEPVIGEGASTVSFPIRVNAKNMPSGDYVLPVKITSAGSFDIEPGRDVFYFVYRNSEEWITEAADKARWSIVNVSSTSQDGDGPDILTDGIGPDVANNYWGVVYGLDCGLYDPGDGYNTLKPGMDQWLILDFGEVLNVGAVRTYPRSVSATTVLDIDFYLSAETPDASVLTPGYKDDAGVLKHGFIYDGSYDINESVWVKAGGRKGIGGAIAEVAFDTLVEGRYLMLRIPFCRDNAALSEIDILRIK